MLVSSCGPKDWCTSVCDSTYLRQAHQLSAKHRENKRSTEWRNNAASTNKLLTQQSRIHHEVLLERKWPDGLRASRQCVQCVVAEYNASQLKDTLGVKVHQTVTHNLLTFVFLCHVRVLQHFLFGTIRVQSSFCNVLLGV